MRVQSVQQTQNMLILSYRKGFGDRETVSDQSQWALVRSDGTIANSTPNLN